MIETAMIDTTQSMASVLIIDPPAVITTDTIGGIPGGMCETAIGTTDSAFAIIADRPSLTGMADIAPTAIAMATVSTAADTVTDIYR